MKRFFTIALLAATLANVAGALWARDWGARENFAVVNPIVRSENAKVMSLSGTWDFSTENPFAYAHVFTYSERAGTPAARRTDRVPVPTRQRRSVALRGLSAAKHREFMRRFLGRDEEILFENPQGDFWPGYTKNYLRVLVPAAEFPGENLANTLRVVRLESLAPSAEALAGTRPRL